MTQKGAHTLASHGYILLSVLHPSLVRHGGASSFAERSQPTSPAPGVILRCRPAAPSRQQPPVLPRRSPPPPRAPPLSRRIVRAAAPSTAPFRRRWWRPARKPARGCRHSRSAGSRAVLWRGRGETLKHTRGVERWAEAGCFRARASHGAPRALLLSAKEAPPGANRARNKGPAGVANCGAPKAVWALNAPRAPSGVLPALPAGGSLTPS